MKEFRKSKGVTHHFTSLEELGAELGSKSVKKKTQKKELTQDQKDILKKRQERLVGMCPVCKQPLTWIEGTNTCACKNAECKGIKKTKKNKDGTESFYYVPVIRILDAKGVRIAESLFGN